MEYFCEECICINASTSASPPHDHVTTGQVLKLLIKEFVQKWIPLLFDLKNAYDDFKHHFETHKGLLNYLEKCSQNKKTDPSSLNKALSLLNYNE